MTKFKTAYRELLDSHAYLYERDIDDAEQEYRDMLIGLVVNVVCIANTLDLLTDSQRTDLHYAADIQEPGAEQD